MRFFSSSSSTCSVCCSIVPVKCAPTPGRNNRLPYETALEKSGGPAGVWSELGFTGYDFFSSLPETCAVAVLVSMAPAVTAAAALAAFFSRPLRDCCCIVLLLFWKETHLWLGMHKDCTNLLANDLGLAGLQHPGADDDGVFG